MARARARIDLPVSTYTQWYWKIDLHNLLHFLTLRVDAHAQWEIQEYGRIMAGMLQRVAPLSYEAWLDYDVCGSHMSRMELEALRALVTVDGGALAGRPERLEGGNLAALGLSPREVRELVAKLVPRPLPSFELDLSTARPGSYFSERFRQAVPAVDAPPPE
jgi:thymidylate synthase (FAD)